MASGTEEPNVNFNFKGSLTLIAFVWLVVTGPERGITAVPTFVTSSLDLVSPSTPPSWGPSYCIHQTFSLYLQQVTLFPGGFGSIALPSGHSLYGVPLSTVTASDPECLLRAPFPTLSDIVVPSAAPNCC